MLTVFLNIIKRDITIAMRRRGDVLVPLMFFAIVVALFPLGVGPDPTLLKTMAPGILWVAALLATMLSIGRMFRDDYLDGTLEQWLLAPQPLVVLVLAKICAHWILTALPLILVSPILAIQLHLPLSAIPMLMLTLLLGTPILSFLGAIGSALTLGVRGSGVLVSLLVLPLYTPVLIFGASALTASIVGDPIAGHLYLLAAGVVMVLTLAPWAIAGALRVSLD